MAYFPFFVDLTDKSGLIVGGGAVAARKVEKLLPYGPQITVVAPDLCREITETAGLVCLRRPFRAEDLAGQTFVIAATDRPEENRRIAKLCREKNIPVNVVDDREACTFLFPALVRRGSLSVGISTGGSSPTAAVYVKEQIQSLLPDDLESTLLWLESHREQVRTAVPEEKRGKAFADLFARCLESGCPTEEELESILEEVCHE